MSANDVVIGAKGFLGGDGTIAGDVANHGLVHPGDAPAPGILTVDGNYTQTSLGTFEVKLGGTVGLFSELVVSGDVNLDGGLQVLLDDGFTLALGDVFDIIDYSGVLSGDFTSRLFPALPPGLTLEERLVPGNVQLVVAGVNPVPEPPVMLSLLFGLGVLGLGQWASGAARRGS